MIRLTTLLCLSFLIFGCSTESNNSVEETAIPFDFINPEIVKKEGLEIHKIDKSIFDAIPVVDADLVKLKTLCENSKGYNSNVWEGLNECSWAVEKERISRHQGQVKRVGTQLILQRENGSLILEHDTLDQTKLFQFIDYFAKSKYYLVETLNEKSCIGSELIHQVNDNQFKLKGRINFAKNGTQFVLYTHNPQGLSLCNSHIELYSLSENDLIKQWQLPLKDRNIQALKYTNNNEIYAALLKKNNNKAALEYIKIVI